MKEFYLSHKPSLQLIEYISSFFEKIDFIKNELDIEQSYIVFENYTRTYTDEFDIIYKTYQKNDLSFGEKIWGDVINEYYCNHDKNKHEHNLIISNLFEKDVDEKIIQFFEKIYTIKKNHYKILIKRAKIINYNKIEYFLNNQISVAIDWCHKNNIKINPIYDKNEAITNYDLALKYFSKEPNVDLNKLKFTNDSIYSISSPDIADKMSKIIKQIYPKAKIIIDGTANIGGNTISFSRYFEKVISIEINKKTADFLENNVKVYNRKNVQIINNDLLKLIQNLKADVIFMDPPWSGVFYKLNCNTDLFLSNKNIIDIIEKLNCNLVALKLPQNYNIIGLIKRYKQAQIFYLNGLLFILIRKSKKI